MGQQPSGQKNQATNVSKDTAKDSPKVPSTPEEKNKEDFTNISKLCELFLGIEEQRKPDDAILLKDKELIIESIANWNKMYNSNNKYSDQYLSSTMVAWDPESHRLAYIAPNREYIRNDPLKIKN